MKSALAFLSAMMIARAVGMPAEVFLEEHCFDCHDTATKKGGLDLTALDFTEENMEMWVKIHDRALSGEMPPKKKKRPDAAALEDVLEIWSSDLTALDRTRQGRDGRSGLRRLNRVEFENSLRDLLGMPALKIKDNLPHDGKSHGFDTLPGALDLSFVHMEAYLAAVDKALNDALCPFPERPPVFKYRYSFTENTRKNGNECEGSVGQAIREKTAIPLNGMKRDVTFVADTPYHLTDTEPMANAVGMFRHEDADFRWNMIAIQPVVTGFHRVRVSGYSFHWDGKEVVPTARHGALGLGIHSTGEHFGTVDLPPNRPAERVFDVWLERGGGMVHGKDDNLRLIAASCENFRDFANGRNKDVPGPMSPAPGVAVEWVEIEGPLYESWPPAGHRALFGDLPVKAWTGDCGAPKPTQQKWADGNPFTFPKDIYGERGENRPVVYVESLEPGKDASVLLGKFLHRALRRPVSETETAEYVAKVMAQLAGGGAFQDAMLSVYREILTSPDFMLLDEPPGKLEDRALASRLSFFLWSSLPDEELSALADQGKLSDPTVLRAQTERMLGDPRSSRFVENFTGQWLGLRQLDDTQPDKKLYPEYMPWLSEAMRMETRAFFAELLKDDLGVSRFVESDFALLNEPLAELYGIPGVRGWDIRKVTLPERSVRGGFLTQAAILKTTANGSTTSPVIRGAFVMEKLLGLVPTPPPPEAGTIEPDVRGATTIREQLAKHRHNPSCASCHDKMDPYGFALESFDVVGEWRDHYRMAGGEGPWEGREKVNGHPIDYRGGLPVDCTGLLPDGRPFADVNGLRSMLAADPERLARAFLLHLTSYATGAPESFADRRVAGEILSRAKPSGYGMRTLIRELVSSDLFTSN